MTEGTTRLLETPERPASFDQHVYEQPGNLAQATTRIPPQANQTSRSLEPTGKSPKGVLTGALIVAILMLTTLFIVLANRSPSTRVTSPPAVTRPELPPIPQPPSPPGGGTQETSINPAFIYPGAQTTMEITDAAEGKMLQLKTSDSFDKVVSWYMAKLKPKNVVKVQQPNLSAVLQGDEMTAIINAKEDGTTIMLTDGDD